jgi:hypothetical protein
MRIQDQIRYRLQQLNEAEKLILLNVVCFVLPLFFKTSLNCLPAGAICFLSHGHWLPIVLYTLDFSTFFGICTSCILLLVCSSTYFPRRHFLMFIF